MLASGSIRKKQVRRLPIVEDAAHAAVSRLL
jgi:hypothetical protein